MCMHASGVCMVALFGFGMCDEYVFMHSNPAVHAS